MAIEAARAVYIRNKGMTLHCSILADLRESATLKRARLLRTPITKAKSSDSYTSNHDLRWRRSFEVVREIG